MKKADMKTLIQNGFSAGVAIYKDGWGFYAGACQHRDSRKVFVQYPEDSGFTVVYGRLPEGVQSLSAASFKEKFPAVLITADPSYTEIIKTAYKIGGADAIRLAQRDGLTLYHDDQNLGRG